MMSTKHRNEVLLEVAEVIGDLQHRCLHGESVLADLTAEAARLVPGAQYAGIIAVHKTMVETVAASHGHVAALEGVERGHIEGPWHPVAWINRVVRIDDLGTEWRWPSYRDTAIALTPIRSVLSLRLSADAKTTGALNLYSEDPHGFDDESVAMGSVFATHAAVVWEIVRRREQFQRALASRDIIGQAKGILMERFRVDAERAFELLKRLSQHSNVPVAEIARRLVHSSDAQQ